MKICLAKDGSFTVHDTNVQYLATEIYKCLNGYSSPLSDEIFLRNSHNLNLRSCTALKVPSVNTVVYGKNSLRYLGSWIWKVVPKDIKDSASLSIFKEKIKKWKPLCPCKLCKQYIANVGFIS